MARKFFTLFGVLALLLAACGSDEGGDGDGASAGTGEDTPGAPSGGDASPAPSGGGGGSVTIGDETITLDSALCFLEEQESAGQTIEATGQGNGTNAAGDDVVVDFTRFAAGGSFEGDDFSVTIGDPFSPDSVTLNASLDLGAATVDDAGISAAGFEWNDDDFNTQAGAAAIEC